jgi:WXG100 family type VII secretion target
MELTTDSARLGAAAQSLAGSADAITAELRRLASASTALAGAWTGEAKDAYQVLYGRFAEDAVRHADELRSIADALGDLAAEYASADSKGAAAQPAP